MNGKQKCSILKNIRRDIAKANGIPLDIPECTHKGDCLGTCPRCEAEVRFLERGLEARRKRGLKIALAGISAGLIAVNATSCDVIDNLGNLISGGEQLDGDMAVESYVTEGSISFADTTAGDTTEEEPESGNFIETQDETIDVSVVKGMLPAVTDIAGEIIEEDYTIEGDIAFIPDDVGGDTVPLPGDVGGDTVHLPDVDSETVTVIIPNDAIVYPETDSDVPEENS
ncbi:MAG: hypothetical protein IJY93_05635 [Clostridia bacterium]|nr:hypothetical protein [Clostridia bacterium]